MLLRIGPRRQCLVSVLRRCTQPLQQLRRFRVRWKFKHVTKLRRLSSRVAGLEPVHAETSVENVANVTAGLTLPLSSGAVEGNVTRIKLPQAHNVRARLASPADCSLHGERRRLCDTLYRPAASTV